MDNLGEIAFMRLVQSLASGCCYCGGQDHNTTNCPWRHTMIEGIKPVPPSVGEFAIEERQRLLAKVEEQAREIERMRSHITTDNSATLVNALAEIERLKAQPSGADEVLKNSARYLFLRDVAGGSWGCMIGDDSETAAEKDGAIDAEIARLNSSPVSTGDDPFWKEKLAIKFCEQRCIADDSPARAGLVDAFCTGLSIGSQQPVSAGDVAARPTGLSQGWNLVRQCDGFVIGHSAEEPKEQHKANALNDGRVYVPFLVPARAGGVDEREAQQCLFVMREIGSLDADDISGDDIDLRFEDCEGRDTGCDVSIVEYAERSAVVLEKLLAALTAPAPNHSEQAWDRLAAALPYLRHAVSDAEKSGVAQLAVVSTNQDGSGRIVCRFDCAEFMSDVADVVGVGPQTEEDTLRAEARQFLDKHGVAVAPSAGSQGGE